MLLQDAIFLDEITHFDRERIPERVVHAKGGGTYMHAFPSEFYGESKEYIIGIFNSFLIISSFD